MSESPKEPQYQKNFDDFKTLGPVPLGPMGSHVWRTDPRRLGFMLARYKFVAKMLHGKDSALEIGCGDGFCAGVTQQEISTVHGLDFDPLFVEAAREQWKGREGFHFFVGDMTDEAFSPPRAYDAAYSLDVLEHIPEESEDLFIRNALKCLNPSGTLIVGCPSLESQEHASIWSKKGHVNCKTGYELKELISCYFKHTFLFGMNDETIHTGFSKMAHYHFVLACEQRP